MSTRQENKVVFVDLTLSSDDEQDPMDTARSQHPAATTTAPTAAVTVSHRSSLDDNPIISGATTRKRERSPPATAPAIPVASRSSLDTTPHDTGASFYSQPAASSASLSFQPSAAFLKRQSPLNALTTTPLTPQGDGAAEFALPLTESIRIALLANITASNATDESEDGIFRPKLKTSPFIRGPSTVTLHRRARLHQRNIVIYRLPSSMVIRDLGSIFDAFVATHPELTESDVCDVLAEIRSDEAVLLADHPTIHAYRIRSAQPTTDAVAVKQVADDNGEKYASERILRVLQQFRLVGAVLVVTRWYGGRMLGPRRFDHITAVAQRCVETRVLGKSTSECTV